MIYELYLLFSPLWYVNGLLFFLISDIVIHIFAGMVEW